jgi:L-alanine-DL-glutamate epimerase-like enolase superfamily enzyme
MSSATVPMNWSMPCSTTSRSCFRIEAKTDVREPIVQLAIHEFSLPLRHVFRIARGAMSVQQTLIVELSSGGQVGYGEATTNEYYGMSFDRMAGALEQLRPLLLDYDLEDPTDLWSIANARIGDCPFALCALDQAAHDLWGKLRGQPVYRLWGLEPGGPLSNFTIGIDTIDRMVAKLEEMPGWPVYKIKLGTPQDLEIVRELRKHTEATFRVDANCGWDIDETIRNSIELSKMNVEFIEQPLPAGEWDGIRRVYETSVLPIIADESCIVESDVEKCHGHYHGINIKLTKCGGLTPARRMIARARRLGMKVMVGCMTESSIGISAIAQLLPLLDYVDMDGAILLARDIAIGVRVDRGRCIYPSVNGTGARLVATPADGALAS